MKERVLYLRETHPDTVYLKKPVKRKGVLQIAPGQGKDGYGRKISTDYMAVSNGVTRRVYCCQYSNAGTCYVIIDGKWHVVGDFDIPEEIRNQ